MKHANTKTAQPALPAAMVVTRMVFSGGGAKAFTGKYLAAWEAKYIKLPFGTVIQKRVPFAFRAVSKDAVNPWSAMTRCLLLSFLLLPFICGTVYAQESGNTQLVVLVESQPVVMTANPGTYSYDPEHLFHEITFNEAYNGTVIYLKLPKSLPELVAAPRFLERYSDYPPEVLILVDNDEVPVMTYETDCFETYAIPSEGANHISIGFMYILAIDVEESYRDVLPYCDNAYEVLRHARGLGDTCDSGRVPQLNDRLEWVCVYPGSVQVLFARGYLL